MGVCSCIINERISSTMILPALVHAQKSMASPGRMQTRIRKESWEKEGGEGREGREERRRK